MLIKVCGIVTPEQVDWAIELGYTAIGLVLYKKSKRYVSPIECRQLAQMAKGKIKTVAVSVDYADLTEVEAFVDYVQFYKGSGHNHISSDRIILAGDTLPNTDNYAYFLYDISHGSGEFKEFPDHLQMMKDKLILAGGLTPQNVKSVVENIQPAGIDVSSGVEGTPGIKSYEKMKEFIQNIKN